MIPNRVLVTAAILAAAACGSEKPVEPEPTPSEQIAEARGAPDGATFVVVTNVIVTFVKPAVGADPAGFFVQAARLGPALFIAVDPATLSPVPIIGDEVSFTITNMGTTAGLRQAAGITGFQRTSEANSIGGFVQNVSNRGDLVSNVTAYESEIVSVSGTATSALGAAGTGFQQASFSTAGLAADPSLKLRLPTTLATALDLASGCLVTLDLVPMWRNGTTAQLSAWTSFDIIVSSCPAPNVGGSEAMSSTTVDVRFDRLIEPGSVVADGNQFTVPGLTVSGATVFRKTVTLTTTTQTPGLSYTITVAGTVNDTYGTALNPAANTTTFTGF